MITPAMSRAAALAVARTMPPYYIRRKVAQAAATAPDDRAFLATAGRLIGLSGKGAAP